MSDTAFIDDVPVYAPEGERAPLHSCQYCDREFDTAAGLKRHQTRTHGTGDSEPKTVKKPGARSAPLKADLVNGLQMIALAVTFVNPVDGQIIGNNAEQVGSAWANLAQKNPKVDRALRALLAGSTYSEVILATSMMLLPILANHKLLPQHVLGMMGYVAAETVANSPDAAEAFNQYYASNGATSSGHSVG